MKKIRKLKKYIILILALNMLFMSVESEKREAEAFAVETAALILGGMAIVGAGGVILSRTGAGTLGEKITEGFEAAGGAISDIFSYNSVTDKGTLVMSSALKFAMNNAIGDLKAATSGISSAEDTGVTTSTGTGYNYANLTSKVAASTGDSVRISFTYSGNPAGYYSTVNAMVGNSASGVLFYFRDKPSSGSFSSTFTVSGNYTKVLVGLRASPDGGSVTISNLKVENLSTMANPAYSQFKQYESISSNSNTRLSQIDSTLAKSEYAVSANSVQENVSSISQLETSMTAIEDNTAGTNTLIDRMITALGNIPAAIKAETSDLWEDAGAIWSGMSDNITNLKTDVNAKMAEMQTAMAGGIDNIRTDIGGMITNLRGGIDAVGANIAGWGQLTLDGIEAGIGTISTGLTNTWTNITTKIIEGVGTITDGIGTITDGLTGVIEWIAGIPAMLFSVFVPPDFAFVNPLMNELQVDFKSKFSSFDAIDQIFQNIFGATKSIYDIQVTFFGRQYYIVPILYKPTIDSFRPFMTGLLDLYVVTLLYRRYKGDAVIPL